MNHINAEYTRRVILSVTSSPPVSVNTHRQDKVTTGSRYVIVTVTCILNPKAIDRCSLMLCSY